MAELIGDVVLLLNGLNLELADAAELARREVAEVAGVVAAEDVDDVVLEEDAGLGVDEVEGGGGAPPADPLEGPLEGGGPRRREEGQHVALRRLGLEAVILGVVGYGPLDQLPELVAVLVGGRRDRGLAQLLHLLPELLDPCFVEELESHL